MATVEPDYLQLWRDLAGRGARRDASSFSYFDNRGRAESFDTRSRRKNQGRQDSLLETVKRELKPDDTVLDVGAGTGRWSVPLAALVSRVTAVEPASAMSDVLIKNAREAGVVDKVAVVNETWDTAKVGIHDIVVCFHAMYSSPDFSAFVRKMEANARRCCYMGIRHFHIDGVMKELSAKVHGSIHDSPDFVIAYNALYQMGIYANVFMENFRQTWTDSTIESALARARRHLHLGENTAYDNLVRKTLEQRLVFDEGAYHWPDRMSTALVWWRRNT